MHLSKYFMSFYFWYDMSQKITAQIYVCGSGNMASENIHQRKKVVFSSVSSQIIKTNNN